jgi:uncharacterized protein (TIGR03435 family)
MKMAVALFLCAAAWGAGDVSGRWSGGFYGGPLYVMLKQDGARVTGSAGPSEGQQMLSIENGKIEGDRLTFQAGPLHCDLRVAGDEIRGEMKNGDESIVLTLVRVEALASRPTAPAKPFEVATVKINRSGGVNTVTGRGGSIRPTRGQILMENVTLWKVLGFAYGIGEDRDYAITGPAWLRTDRYDIVAKVPAETAWPQIQAMMQALLAERFRMTLHRESKEMPVYALVAARDGFKLHAVEAGRGSFSIGRGAIKAQKATISALADRLGQVLDRPVVDQTGILGTFDFTIEWAPDESAAAPAAEGGEARPASGGMSIFTAIQQQLGLRLEARRAPVEVLVVDRAERAPIEN